MIVLRFNYLYRMYLGNNGMMYTPLEAKQLVDAGKARYARREVGQDAD